MKCVTSKGWARNRLLAAMNSSSLPAGGAVFTRDSVTWGENFCPSGGWPERTTQGGDALRGLLAEMGASVTRVPEGLRVTGPGRVTVVAGPRSSVFASGEAIVGLPTPV